MIPQIVFIHNFEEYIRSMPQWMSKLISNFKTNPLSERLLNHIQQQTQLLISTNGSRSNTKSGGNQITSLTDGAIIVSDWNLDFGQITNTYSYHSEIYASLASFTFLQCYCDYCFLPLFNPIEAYCDNKSYLTK